LLKVGGKWEDICDPCNFSLTILIGYKPLPILISVMRKGPRICALFLHDTSIRRAEKLWLVGNDVRKMTSKEV